MSRLTVALAISLCAHAALLAGWWPSNKQAKPTTLDVVINPPRPVESLPPVEQLIKDTIAESDKPAPEKPAQKLPPPKPATNERAASKPAAPLTPKQAAAAMQRKINELVVYPKAAIDAKLEGTVFLLLILDSNGQIKDVSVAASSSHPILDNAAIRAALAAGRFDAGGKTSVTLPIQFQLQ